MTSHCRSEHRRLSFVQDVASTFRVACIKLTIKERIADVLEEYVDVVRVLFLANLGANRVTDRWYATATDHGGNVGEGSTCALSEPC